MILATGFSGASSILSSLLLMGVAIPAGLVQLVVMLVLAAVGIGVAVLPPPAEGAPASPIISASIARSRLQRPLQAGFLHLFCFARAGALRCAAAAQRPAYLPRW